MTSARSVVAATMGRRRELGLLTLWALVGAVPTLVSGQAVAHALDDGFLAGKTGSGLAWLGVLAATVPLGAWGARRTYLGVARLVEPLRDDLVRSVVEGALVRSTGPDAVTNTAAVARLTQHVELVRDTVAGLLLLVLSFVAAMIAALVGVLSLAPLVLPLIAVPLLVSFGAFAASLREVARQQRRVLLADERLAELASVTVGPGLRDIVACGAEDEMADALDARINEQVAAGKAMARVAAVRIVIVSVGARLPVLLVLVAARWLLDRGVSEGALLGALTYLIQGLGPAVASVVAGIGAPLAQLLVTVDRLDEDPGGGQADPQPPTRIAVPEEASVVLRGVTFRYRTAAEAVVSQLDLDIAPGDHLAVVGPSGAGKSTLAALLVGLLEPQAGTIRHGGRPVASVAATHRVLIPQQAYVFRGTLDENLRYLRPEASAAELARATAAVGLDELVDRLGGTDAELEPGRLSAGERQLITLARAHLSTARLIVLDEATCHLDPTAEARVEGAFAARGGTLVVVAHRISSAQRARRILLMDGGDPLLGTHEELIRESPVYRDLVGHWLDHDREPMTFGAPTGL